jgi:hypothetical protein
MNVCLGNVYLGIDWSQMKHDLCWMNEAGAVVARQTILHSTDGFAKLDDARQRLGVAPEACLVGIETAHSLLIDFLWARGYTQLYVLAPGMINSTRGTRLPPPGGGPAKWRQERCQ